jgi:major vault protein
VFPEPTEIFIEKAIDKQNASSSKTRKFKATELNPNSGIYIKVIADYTENGVSYIQGEELFITGKEQMIYFPRKEHAIIRYEEDEIHYGIAIPAGEGRYVLDRNKGSISLRKGPEIFLPDPRNEVVAKRALALNLVELMYPENQEALEYNAGLLGVDLNEYFSNKGSSRSLENAIGPTAAGLMYSAECAVDAGDFEAQTKGLVSRGMKRSRREITRQAAEGFEGDSFTRKTQYTPTREVMLQTKYSGAVSLDIWSGYAVMLVSKSGNRRVVTGPQTVMLEYDETPQVMRLSTGKPKTTDNPYSTAYLKMFANKVADVITLETKDFCKMNVKLSYRVNFEGEKENWFNVDNYVKFLCDHMRSMLRNTSLQYDIQELYSNVMNIIRDTVLGKQNENGKRTGFEFSENGMRIYDVDVLSVVMENKDVEQSLIGNQRESLKQQLQLVSETERLEHAKKIEVIKREHLHTKAETNELTLGLQKKEYEQQLEVEKQRLANNAEVQTLEIVQRFENEKAHSAISSEKVKRSKEEKELLLAISKEEAGIRVSELAAQAQSVVVKAEAISPNLIAALQSYGDQETLQRVAKAMAPMSIIGGETVKEALTGLLAGTPIAEKLDDLLGSSKNNKSLPENLKSS